MSPTPKTLMTGKMKCGACGMKLRDHPGFGPCPYWEAGVVSLSVWKEQMKGRKKLR